MADPSSDELTTLTDQANASPAIKAFLASQATWRNRADLDRAQATLKTGLAREGIDLPHDWVFDVNGPETPITLKKNGVFTRNPWLAPALIMGTAATAGALAPAVMGGAAPVTAAGGGSAAVGGGTAMGALAGGLTPSFAVPASLAGTGGTTAATGGILGALGKYGGAASDIGEIATAGAGANAAGRREDSYADVLAAWRNNGALVDAATFNRDLPMSRAQQTARGDLMASPIPNSTTTGTGRNIQFSGGVQPSSFGADTTQAGEDLKRQALMKLMDPEADKLTPQLTTPRRAGAGENIGAGVGIGLGVLGALGRYGRWGRPAPLCEVSRNDS